MNEINISFMEVFYKKELTQFLGENEKFYEKALLLKSELPASHDWRCNTFSTMKSSYNLAEDPLFKGLVTACEQETNSFSKSFGINKGQAKCTSAWVNVSEFGSYQEYHHHTNSHFSLVYYVETPLDCGNLVFRSHEQHSDMFPLPEQELTPLSFKTFSIVPKAGEVIIFRSNLSHMVELNRAATPRVSISMNMVINT